MNKRKENEKKYTNWIDSEGERMYFSWINGRYGWKAKYIKVVNNNEETISFSQEIYNDKRELTEIHEKYPIDKGHIKLKNEAN